MKTITEILTLLLFVSCSAITTNFSNDSLKNDFYRRDMSIKANGSKSSGYLVIPQSNNLNIEVSSVGKLDLFTLTTCHREITQEDAGYKGKFLGLGSDNKLAKLEFYPAKGLEDAGSCPIDFGGYDKHGKHSWGTLLIENPGSKLSSLVKCNGRETVYNGTSACQSRAGLLQRIEFSEPVVVSLDSKCKYDYKFLDNNKVFEYKMPLGNCLNYFMSKSNGNKINDHYDFGYNKIIIIGE